jgi:hypothetical protein
MTTPAEKLAMRAAAQRARRARKREAAAVASGDTRTPNERVRGRAAGKPGWAWRGTGGGGKAKAPPAAALLLTPLHVAHVVLDGQGVELVSVVGFERALAATKTRPKAICVLGVAQDGTSRVLARCGHGGDVPSDVACSTARRRWLARAGQEIPALDSCRAHGAHGETAPALSDGAAAVEAGNSASPRESPLPTGFSRRDPGHGTRPTPSRLAADSRAAG